MTYLLDTSVLIALIDRAHVHHALTRTWFASLEGGWATCPITENGVVRILSTPAYRNILTPGEVIRLLTQLQQLGAHEFWPDDLSLLDASMFRHTDIQRFSQITDSYLLGLAASRGGKLATLDSRITTAGVHGGGDSLLVLGR